MQATVASHVLEIAKRPVHGALDVAFLMDLAVGADKEAFCVEVLRALEEAANRVPHVLEERLRGGDHALAVEAADALLEVIGCSVASLGALRLAAGSPGACGRYLLGAGREVVRPYESGDPEHPCEYGCAPGHCLLDDGLPIETRRVLRDWRLCGGMLRSTWPRAGGLEDQDAAVVFWFHELDRLAEAGLRHGGADQERRAEAGHAGV